MVGAQWALPMLMQSTTYKVVPTFYSNSYCHFRMHVGAHLHLPAKVHLLAELFSDMPIPSSPQEAFQSISKKYCDSRLEYLREGIRKKIRDYLGIFPNIGGGVSSIPKLLLS